MARKIFVNLPVADIARSKAFVRALGLRLNAAFSSDANLCVVVSDDIYVMLLTHARFKDFAPGPISDAHAATEVLVCLSCESRAEVDDLVAKATAAGGTTFRPPDDHGFMYGRAFRDPDGHVWELMWMDPATVPPAA